MAVKLHRCPLMWAKGPHPCWKVQQALDEQGIEYEVVREPWLPRSRRTELKARTGTTALPAIELDDGRYLREESADLVARIREGRLFDAPAPT
jgi:glutathione S-transferase